MKWVVRLAIGVIIFYGTFSYAQQNMKEWYWMVIFPAIGRQCEPAHARRDGRDPRARGLRPLERVRVDCPVEAVCRCP